MKSAASDYAVREGTRVNLKKWPTRVEPLYRNDDDYDEILGKHRAKLSGLQELLYASNRHALLVILQGMDTCGKDGVIKHVMTGVNPQGCRVSTFKHPSGTELQHDFLWRAVEQLPERGHIGIFNRSYYEEVLIVRVHPELLRAEGLPDSLQKRAKVWKGRYRSINDLEAHLARSGTHVIKFFLHLSKEEQRQRLLARIDDPQKRWKFQGTDVEERGFWAEYMDAYAASIEATSTEEAPWHVVPADDKRTARLIVSKAITERLEGLDMRYPELGTDDQQRLRAFREALGQ
jgi:PPK2 family polyphosphate:nucleotide phosphotransferase